MLWTGRGEVPWPQRSSVRLTARIGVDQATELLPRIKELEREFYMFLADMPVGQDLFSAMRAREEAFLVRHPELSEAAVSALGWCWSYDHRT